MNMSMPSSTITAAFIAGQAVAVFWGLVGTFTSFEPTMALVSESVILAASIVGYLKKEKVLPVGNIH